MSDELDNAPLDAPPVPAPLPTADLAGPDPVLSERARKGAETRKKKKQAKEDRQRRAVEKRAAQKAARTAELEEKREREEEKRAAPASDAPPGEAAAGGTDEEWENWVRDEMERPLNGPEDLAELLGKIQMTLIGAAQGTDFEEAAWSLQWTNGKDPLRRAKIGSRCLWPWMKKNGYDGVKLAQQSEGVLAAIGAFVLVGPSLRPALDAIQRARAKTAKATADAAAQTLTTATETTPAPAERN